MIKRAARNPGNRERRWWPTPSIALASAAVFLALGGSAVAARGLIQAGDIAPGAVTGRAIRSGAVEPADLSTNTRALLQGGQGATGARGDTGPSGAPGSNGANGPNGANGAEGAKGNNGANGANGPNGANGVNGIDGTDGADGTNGTDGAKGSNGVNGTNGTNGANGTIAPLAATKGLTALPTASPPTTVVELTVPAGNYVVLAKTQLSHTGAGDSVECALKAGATTIDQIAMKTLPALAAIPASLQAVTTTTATTQLSVQCSVLVANGAANFNSLIAIPTA
jgi:hypothetical protein